MLYMNDEVILDILANEALNTLNNALDETIPQGRVKHSKLVKNF